MAITKLRISEQAKKIIGGTVSLQALLVYVDQAFSWVVRKRVFQDKAEGEAAILNGNFIFTFPHNTVQLDTDQNLYYATLPSSYIDLPNELGVYGVSLPKSPDQQFVLIKSGYFGMLKNLAIENLEGNTPAYVEGNRIYFPYMNSAEPFTDVMIKLLCSLEGIAPDTQINLPPDIQMECIEKTVELFMGKTQLKDAKTIEE